MSAEQAEQTETETPRRYRPRLRDAERAVLVRKLGREYDDGASFRELSARYGLSYGLTRRLVMESGVTVRPRGVASVPADGGA